MTGVIAMLG